MSGFRLAGIPHEVAREVRSTMRAPGYDHPVSREVATGTGPCRSCLGLFAVGEEERLLFTYRPAGGRGTTTAPGPVFIHCDACERFDGVSFPEALRALPLLLEARAAGGRVLECVATTGAAVDEDIERLLATEETEFLFLRHGEAGCHIARIDRAHAAATGRS